MKKIVLLVVLTVLPLLTFGQSIFEKYADNDEVTYVSIKPKMFKMLATIDIDTDDPEAKEFMKMVNSIKSLKTLMTSNASIASDIKKWVKTKSSSLEELMEVKHEGARVKFYVKEGKSETHVKELLMSVTGMDRVEVNGSSPRAIVVSLTGDIDLNQVSKLTNKMNIPGGEHLKNVKKKGRK